MSSELTSVPVEQKVKRTSHLVHVAELPADAVAITKYGKHTFSNLYYSPSTDKLYQRYARRIREIDMSNDEHGKARKIYARSDQKNTTYISKKKLKEELRKKKKNDEIEEEEEESSESSSSSSTEGVTECDSSSSDSSSDTSSSDDTTTSDTTSSDSSSDSSSSDSSSSSESEPEPVVKPKQEEKKETKKIAKKQRKRDASKHPIYRLTDKTARSQVGQVTNARHALKLATADKHSTSRRKNIKKEDLVL